MIWKQAISHWSPKENLSHRIQNDNYFFFREIDYPTSTLLWWRRKWSMENTRASCGKEMAMAYMHIYPYIYLYITYHFFLWIPGTGEIIKSKDMVPWRQSLPCCLILTTVQLTQVSEPLGHPDSDWDGGRIMNFLFIQVHMRIKLHFPWWTIFQEGRLDKGRKPSYFYILQRKSQWQKTFA